MIYKLLCNQKNQRIYNFFQDNMQKQVVNDFDYFKSIKKEDRSQWLVDMLNTPQLDELFKGQKVSYPNSDKWKYKDFNIQYYFRGESKNPSALIFYFHGMNSYGGSTGYFASRMQKQCDAHVYTIDFLNFGYSDSPQRGYLDNLESQVDQADQFIKFIESKYGQSVKIFISGLSLGGAICYRLGLKYPNKFKGSVLLAPAIRLNGQSQPFMKKVGKIFGYLLPKLKILQPKFTEQSRYNITEYFKSDPGNYSGKVVPGTGRSIIIAAEETEKTFGQYQCPYICIQGGVDKLIDPFLAVDLHQQSPSKDKTTFMIKQMWHAISAQPQYDMILDMVAKWINQRK